MNTRSRVGTIGLAMMLRCFFGAQALGCTLDSKSVGEDGGSSDDTASATDPTAPSESGALLCEQYESADEIGPRVEIAVRSAAAGTVWFASDGGCISASPDYTITNAEGEDVRYWLDSCADVFCDQILEADSCWGNCNDCGSPLSGSMDPGTMVQTGWVGREMSTLEVDPQCAVDDDCPATCERMDQAPPGMYEIAVTVYRSCTGECACDEEFSPCALWAAHELGDPVTYTASIDYPAQTSVEFVIDDG